MSILSSSGKCVICEIIRLVAFYSVVYLAILLANIHFIRQTKKKVFPQQQISFTLSSNQVHSKVSLFVILTHPAGRLLLGMEPSNALSSFDRFVDLHSFFIDTSGLIFTRRSTGIIAFFITCAFAAPVDEEKGTLNQYINRFQF